MMCAPYVGIHGDSGRSGRSRAPCARDISTSMYVISRSRLKLFVVSGPQFIRRQETAPTMMCAPYVRIHGDFGRSELLFAIQTIRRRETAPAIPWATPLQITIQNIRRRETAPTIPWATPLQITIQNIRRRETAPTGSACT